MKILDLDIRQPMSAGIQITVGVFMYIPPMSPVAETAGVY